MRGRSALVVLGVLAASCGDGGRTADRRAAGQAGSGAIEASALYAELTGLDGPERLLRHEDGVTLSGAIGGVDDQGDDGGGLVARIPAGGDASVVLRFDVESARPALAVGERVTARCRIGPVVDRTLYLDRCAVLARALVDGGPER